MSGSPVSNLESPFSYASAQVQSSPIEPQGSTQIAFHAPQ